MYEVRDTEFPAMVFSFKPFGEIASSENADQSSFFGINILRYFVVQILFFNSKYTDLIFFLADIIGVITSPGRVVKQSRYRLIEVEISDEQYVFLHF